MPLLDEVTGTGQVHQMAARLDWESSFCPAPCTSEAQDLQLGVGRKDPAPSHSHCSKNQIDMLTLSQCIPKRRKQERALASDAKTV